MPGKWAERGIEDSHGHLIADEEGTVVCTKRKEREEVPVGKMILKRSENISFPFGEKSKAEEFLNQDQLLQEFYQRFENASEALRDALANSEAWKMKIVERLRAIAYQKCLAAPDLEKLHDKRFACPSHPDSRFLWKARAFHHQQRIPQYQRSCLECSLPSHFRETSVGSLKEELTYAYECPCCGIVLGSFRTERSSEWGYSENYYCTLCDRFLEDYVADVGR